MGKIVIHNRLDMDHSNDIHVPGDYDVITFETSQGPIQVQFAKDGTLELYGQYAFSLHPEASNHITVHMDRTPRREK